MQCPDGMIFAWVQSPGWAELPKYLCYPPPPVRLWGGADILLVAQVLLLLSVRSTGVSYLVLRVRYVVPRVCWSYLESYRVLLPLKVFK